MDEYDAFGAQQQSAFERLSIPASVDAPEMALAFEYLAGAGGRGLGVRKTILAGRISTISPTVCPISRRCARGRLQPA